MYIMFNVNYIIVIAIAWVLSPVQLFVAPWTAAGQSPLSMEFFQTKILKWVAISSSRESS